MKLLILTLSVLMTLPSLAKVKLEETSPILIPKSPEPAITSKDVEKIIPIDMNESKDMGYVASKIGDQTLQTWFNQPEVRNSSIGQTAAKVEESMKTEVEVKGANENSVDHKFSFQVLALQTKTKVQYTGWLNAVLNYDARFRETVFEINEKIWNNKQFFISHTNRGSAELDTDLSTMGLRWSW